MQLQYIPFVRGMSLGVGCNLLTGKILDNPFDNLDQFLNEDISSEQIFQVHRITNTEDLKKKLSLEVSSSLLSGGLFSTVNPAANLLHEHKLSGDNIYLLLSVQVIHSYEFLKEYPLKPEVLSLLEDQKLDPFYASYGRGFVAGFIKGGCYYGLIEIQTNSLEEKKDLSGKLNFKTLLGNSLGLDVQSHLSNTFTNKRVQISVFRSGGLQASTGLTLEDMLFEASNFPNSIAENPSRTFAHYRNYDEIVPFSTMAYSLKQEYNEYTQCVQSLENIYLQYCDYYNTLKSIIKFSDSAEFLRSWQESTENIQSVVEGDLEGISAQIKEIESLIDNCHKNITPCTIPSTLYQLDSTVKEILDSLIEQSEDLEQIESANQPSWAKEIEEKSLCHYNVAVVGITGVGKSSLINYLYGEKVAKTGIGKPITKRGFQNYEFTIGDLPVKLFDSWGLEINKVDEWMKELDKELDKRGIDRPADEWFHTILYCINAGGGRIQERDRDIIKRFLKNKYQVIVVITRADTISKEEEVKFSQEIREYLQQENLSIIAVCSESKKDRRGNTIEVFGKKEVEKQIYSNFWDTIIARLPQHCRNVVEKYLDDWETEQINQIERQKKTGESLNTIQENLIEAFSDINIEEVIQKEIYQTMYIYGKILDNIQNKWMNESQNSDNDKLFKSSKVYDKNQVVLSSIFVTSTSTIFGATSTMINPTFLSMFIAVNIYNPFHSISLSMLIVKSVFTVLTGSILAGSVLAGSVLTHFVGRQQRNSKIVDFIEIVKTETQKIREGLDNFESEIEKKLKDCQRITFHS